MARFPGNGIRETRLLSEKIPRGMASISWLPISGESHGLHFPENDIGGPNNEWQPVNSPGNMAGRPRYPGIFPDRPDFPGNILTDILREVEAELPGSGDFPDT